MIVAPVVLSLLVSALANAADCQTAGTCAGDDAVPAGGDALLQLPALLEKTKHPQETPLAHQQQRSTKSLMQAEALGGNGLPAEAKKLFNEKLCKATPARGLPNSTELNDRFNENNILLGESDTLGPKSSNPKKTRKEGYDQQLQPRESSVSRSLFADSSNKQKFRKEENDQHLQPSGSSFSRSLLDDFGLEDLAGDRNLESLGASLDQAGFAKVRQLRDSEEMAMYIRRVADSCNMMIIDEGGLNGAVDWFKNPGDAGANFETLKTDLFRALLAASKDHWVTVKDVHGISADTAPLDLFGFVQVRALRQKKQTIQFVKRMVAEMGIKITNMDGFNGLMAYYSEPDDSESFPKLVAEIKKAAYERKWAEMV